MRLFTCARALNPMSLMKLYFFHLGIHIVTTKPDRKALTRHGFCGLLDDMNTNVMD